MFQYRALTQLQHDWSDHGQKMKRHQNKEITSPFIEIWINNILGKKANKTKSLILHIK